MKLKYKKIDIRTISGIIEAEILKGEGWTLYSIGFYTLHFYKEEK